MNVEISHLEGAWEEDHGFYHPDWKVIGTYLRQQFSEADQPLVWHEASLQWLRILQKGLGPAYSLYESKNFLMLSAFTKSRTTYLLKGCEASLAAMRHGLGSLCWDWKNGKSVVLLFQETEPYYQYISHFHAQEGEDIQSSGVFIRRGYCHIALSPVTEAMPVLTHELTHLCLCHLPLPAWLNEGLATNLEKQITGKDFISRRGASNYLSDIKEMREYWTSERINGFWDGTSFHNPDSSGFCYRLAEILVRNLMEDCPSFPDFVKEAMRTDGGELSAIKHLDLGLSDIAASFLGEGDWSFKVPPPVPPAPPVSKT